MKRIRQVMAEEWPQCTDKLTRWFVRYKFSVACITSRTQYPGSNLTRNAVWFNRGKRPDMAEKC